MPLAAITAASAIPTPATSNTVAADEGVELSPDRIETWVATEPGGGIAPAGPSCDRWHQLISDPNHPAHNTVIVSRVHPDGIVARLNVRRCDTRYQFAWIREETPESLADTAVRELSDERSRVLPLPELRLSPARLAVVNLETWLAVAEVGEVSITAAVPGVSITVTARVEATVFEITAPDITAPDITATSDHPAPSTVTVECAGTGVIWERSLPDDSAGCTHTFTRASAEPASISASLIWAGRWQSSTGASGDIGTVRGRSSRIEIPVVEIVTVGRR